MDNIKIRCLSCGKEMEGHQTKTVSCGCSNMATIRGDKISATDLSLVVMINAHQKTKNSFLSREDLAFQEQRRQRKVRKMNFEIR
jgi:hypothetical protein